MHTSTLFLVALASIMVTFTSAKPLDKESSIASIPPNLDNQGPRGNFHQKRKMRKRFSPGNSGARHSSYSPSTQVSPAASVPASSGGGLGGGLTDGLTDGLPIVGAAGLTGATGGATGGLPVVGDLL